MQQRIVAIKRTTFSRGKQAVPVAAVVLALSACGSVDSGSSPSAAADASASSSVQSLALTLPAQGSAEVAAQLAQPQFHVAPVVLASPDDTDVDDPAASALSAPHRQRVTPELSQLSTRHLTQAAMESVLHDGIVPDEFAADGSAATPLASGTAVATYTPAQIRAAYGLPALAAGNTSLSSLQAAQLGAGQTIYLIDAQHDPNAAAELATFNQKFGLPSCSVTSIAASAALPLPAAATSGCTFSVVYSTAAGGMTSTAPGYDSGWATEIALDVQWAHATAPLARIILIEAPNASVNDLVAAVELANAMGPGVVSMSFGSQEGSWTASLDASFANASMTYVAAAGDAGSGVNWPAVSARVLAVGGSTLSYSASAPRSEIVWSGTGGGVSQYTPTPSYQSSAVPDMGTPAFRSVNDVTFNADPTTGQYIDVMAPGSTSPSWLSAGGTSLSTPQWAGIIAVANALRAQAAQPVLGDPHAKIYAIATQATQYASDFYDITQGSDGSCASCYAQIGYDLPSGIGTPNVGSLLSSLGASSTGSAPVTPTPQAPVVASASVSGTAGSALLYPVSVTDANPVSFTLNGAPSGMTISAAGVLGWSAPVTGSYSVTVTAKDAKTGLSGHGVIVIAIAAAKPPAVSAVNVSAIAGKALSFTVTVSAPDAVTWSLSGAPAGMSISGSGVVTWANPVAGSYSVSASAKDTRTGLSGSGLCTVKVTPAGPVITASTMNGKVGTALSGTLSFSDSTSNSLNITIAGVPTGMTLTPSGPTLALHWAAPVTGSYRLSVTAKDGNGLSASLTVPVTITAH
jgi:hypothetical protein